MSMHLSPKEIASRAEAFIKFKALRNESGAGFGLASWYATMCRHGIENCLTMRSMYGRGLEETNAI